MKQREGKLSRQERVKYNVLEYEYFVHSNRDIGMLVDVILEVHVEVLFDYFY